MKWRFPAERHIEDVSKDRFGFKDLSQHLVDEVVLHMETPNTFGIYGNWGTGKTSIMNFMRTNLQQKEGVITVFFESWKYEQLSDSDLAFALLRNIQNTLDLKLPLWKRISLPLISIMIWASKGFFKLLKIPVIPLKWLISIEGKVDSWRFQDLVQTWKRWDKIIKTDYERWTDTSEKFKLEFHKLVIKGLKKNIGTYANNMKLVVFIDDLDRCLPEHTVRMLEVLKNYLSVENMIYIIAIDRRVVSKMIEKKYGLYKGYGDEYLMKIIHYFYELPRPDMEFYVDDILKMLDRENEKIIAKAILRSLIKEPRKAKYVLNNFAIAAAMSQRKSQEYLNSFSSDVYSPKLVALVALILMMKFPQLFEGDAKKKLLSLYEHAQHAEMRHHEIRKLKREDLLCLSDEEIQEAEYFLRLGKNDEIPIKAEKIYLAYEYLSRLIGSDAE